MNNFRGGFGGFGGANLNQLMKQAQKMQADMEAKKNELHATEFKATAGGGMVEVTMMGSRTLKSIKFKPEIVDPDDVEMLEDLVLSAVKEALAKAEKISADQMSKITGGLNIPGLM